MKGPETTNSYGIVHNVNSSPNKHLKKKLKRDSEVKSLRSAERRKVVKSLASRRLDAFKWLETEVANNVDAELISVRCPSCKKGAFLCKTPLNAIAWSDTSRFPWAVHKCSVDKHYPNSKLTDTELSNHKALSISYLKLRTLMTKKGGVNG